jgi:hypothetical protein
MELTFVAEQRLDLAINLIRGWMRQLEQLRVVVILYPELYAKGVQNSTIDVELLFGNDQQNMSLRSGPRSQLRIIRSLTLYDDLCVANPRYRGPPGLPMMKNRRMPDRDECIENYIEYEAVPSSSECAWYGLELRTAEAGELDLDKALNDPCGKRCHRWLLEHLRHPTTP